MNDRGLLKGGHARAFGHICYALCFGLVLLPSLSGVNVLRDDVIDYKQMICSSTLLRNGNMVISTTVVDLKEQYTSCQVLWCFSTLDIEGGYWQAELQGNNKKLEGVFPERGPWHRRADDIIVLVADIQ